MVDTRVAATIATYDLVADDYASVNAQRNDELAAFRDRFVSQLPTGGRLADMGCGPGHDAAWFRHHTDCVVGVDMSAAMLRIASAQGVPAVLGDLRHPPFRREAFDGIWSIASLLHVPLDETVATLRAWRDVLRPGGLLGLSTSLGAVEQWEPVPYQPRVAHSARVGLQRWFAHRDSTRLLAQLATAGFQVEECTSQISHRSWIQIIASRSK